MSIQCPGNVTPSMDPTASVVLKAAANVNATVGLFAVVSGTFPNISKFYLHFGAYSNLDVLGRIAKRLTRRSRCRPRWHYRR